MTLFSIPLEIKICAPWKNFTTVATPTFKVKYKSLWGKVGKQGMMQAAAEKADSSSSSSAGSRSKKQPTGWDQLMKPLMQQQRAQAEAAAQSQAQQQTYQQYSYQHTQQVQMGSASAGSGWSGANMECDCGEDTCPRCNLLLAMGDGYWSCPLPPPSKVFFRKLLGLI